ncbi:HEAT repeat domain-containing protein [Streptomyces sp. NPDC020362]|uniref:HEAT repeat domain-containing protein n=1 Tax=unclassified Streptomyces TaxID=2593676 RepID=UPI0033F6B177
MGAGDGGRLVAAVRHGDAERVRDLLDAGAAPDALDESTGLPVLCRAIAAHDEPVAEALVAYGADPLRRLPDGTTPLLRAVASGSLCLTWAVFPEVVRRPGPAREELLDRARHWARTDPEAELRRRTGLPGPAERTRAEDGTGCWYERLTLGGQTLCEGHLAILTSLEAKLRLRTPFDELLARARAYPDRDHQTWSETVMVLGNRLDEETWAEAGDLSRDPDPLNRLFAADVQLSLVIADARQRKSRFQDRAREFVPWAERERDGQVLQVLLNGLTWVDGPETEAVGLSYATHPDPDVRSWVPDLLDVDPQGLAPRSLAAVLALARDPDADVRDRTCFWLAHYRGTEPEIVDVLLELTRDERQRTRAYAVAGLAARDDPRCVEAEHRIGPLEAKGEYAHERLPLTAVWHYRRRREERAEDRHLPSDYPGGSIHPPGQE